MAVLPTPGSPISTGLFLVRRCSTWIARRISSSRPITGSSLPSRARSVRSSVYFFSASRWPSASAESTFCPPRTCSIAASSALRVRPWPRTMPAKSVFASASASRNISLAMNWSPRLLASFSAALQQRDQFAPGLHRLVAALHLRQAVDRGVERRLQRRQVARRRARAARLRAFVLRQHRGDDVDGLDVRVVARHGEALRVGQRFLEAAGELVGSHG